MKLKTAAIVALSSLTLFVSVACAEVTSNKLSANKLAVNKLAANKLAVNRLAANKLAVNKLSANKLATNKLTANRISLNGNSLTAAISSPIENNGSSNGLQLMGVGASEGRLVEK